MGYLAAMPDAPDRRRATTRRRFLQVTSAGAVSLVLEGCSDSAGPGTGTGGDENGDESGTGGDTDSDTGTDTSADTDTGTDTGTGVSPDPDLPAITPNDEFFVKTKAETPTVDPDTWKLVIDGAVEAELSLSMADLDALGAQDKEQTLACIWTIPEMPTIGNAVWSGRPLAELFDAAGVTPTGAAIELHFESADGYQTAIPISDLEDRELWLVWRMNGEPLPVEHGYPARLLVPGRYGQKNPKWITRIGFGTEPLIGTWESVGLSNDASYLPLCLFMSPGEGETVALAPVALQGCAFCGSVAITKVEVSTDGGEVWHEAGVTYEGPADTWTLWRYDWTPPGPGSYDLLVRIECADGQATDPDYVVDLNGYGGYGTLSLKVEG